MARDILASNPDEEALLELQSVRALYNQDPMEKLVADQMPLMHQFSHDRLLRDAEEKFAQLQPEENTGHWNYQNIDQAAYRIADAYRGYVVADLLLEFAPIVLETASRPESLPIRQRIRRKRYLQLTRIFQEENAHARNAIDQSARDIMEARISSIIHSIGTN